MSKINEWLQSRLGTHPKLALAIAAAIGAFLEGIGIPETFINIALSIFG